jgi:hypothetical protein
VEKEYELSEDPRIYEMSIEKRSGPKKARVREGKCKR